MPRNHGPLSSRELHALKGLGLMLSLSQINRPARRPWSSQVRLLPNPNQGSLQCDRFTPQDTPALTAATWVS